MIEAAPARSVDASPPRVRSGQAWAAISLAFVASFATLVLELVAGRMLSPYVGVSLHTWTAVIGVVLAGISLGNWIGGALADRASPSLLPGLFVLGSISSVATLVIVPILGRSSPLIDAPLLVRTFGLSTAAFLAPALVLGMVTPVVIRRALPEVRATGRTVGLIYAAGTAGSLLGNFATGFILTAYFTTTTIVLSVGAVLLATGILAGRLRADAGPGRRDQTEAVVETALRDDRPPVGRLDLRRGLAMAWLVVFVSSFATMTVELGASRILAPYLGLSLYSWTGIIGVVLAAIALGNVLGGRMADRWPSQSVLGLSLFAGGIGALAILLLEDLLNTRELWTGLGLIERILAQTAVVFFLPILLLGTISPQVTRLAVVDVRTAGRTAGSIYAVSTAGAIVGTFATGWWLIPALGVHRLTFAMGLLLLGVSFVVGRFWRRLPLLGVLVIVAAAPLAAIVSGDAVRSRCTVETEYFCIKVGEEQRAVGLVKVLVLDHLVHSYVKVGDPSYLGYVHEEIQAEITRFYATFDPALRVLLIGGGGYTYPRWIEWSLPRASVDVVEIDPGVTEVNYTHLGLSRDTRIASFNLDGRQFVQEHAQPGGYAIVVQDAVNDLSVPYHILTREYKLAVRRLLKPDGVYLLTVIDLYRDGQLLRATLRTMREAFPSVQLFAAGPAWESGGANVWVIAGSRDGVDLSRVRTANLAQGIDQIRTHEMPADLLDRYVRDGPQIVLTDEYAPVDNLIAILFRSRG